MKYVRKVTGTGSDISMIWMYQSIIKPIKLTIKKNIPTHEIQIQIAKYVKNKTLQIKCRSSYTSISHVGGYIINPFRKGHK